MGLKSDAESELPKGVANLLLHQLETALSSTERTLPSAAEREAIRVMSLTHASARDLLGVCEILYGAYNVEAPSQRYYQHYRSELSRLATLVDSFEDSLALRLEVRDFARELFRSQSSRNPGQASVDVSRGAEDMVVDARACFIPGSIPKPVQCRRGQIVALVGGNGTGKSSILRLLAGYSTYAEGQTNPAVAVTRRYIPDRVARPGHSVWGSLVATASSARTQRGKLKDVCRDVETLLQELGLEVFHKPWRTLSEGQAKRFAIAQAILAEPDVILVDEPMANLDERAEIQQRSALLHFAHANTTASLPEWRHARS